MTSINTNIAAQTALRTLQDTNAQLDKTQGRISTGLKIAEAKDNAAYWSISTTLKSDSRSLSTVQDALSLGAATVDAAYQGTNQVRAVLEEIQNKIVLASGNSADKVALQKEIEQLQQNLRAFSGSSGFSGENWLSVDSSATGYSDTKSVVSSFNREKSGGVTLDTIQIEGADFVLINSDPTKSGILDGGKSGNSESGGLADKTKVDGSVAADAKKASITLGAFNYVAASGGTVGGDTKIEATIKVDANDYELEIADPDDFDTIEELKTAIENAAIAGGGAKLSTVADVSIVDNKIVLTHKTGGDGKTIEVTAFTLTDDTTATTKASFAGLAVADEAEGEDAVLFEAAKIEMTAAFSNDIELDADDKITFKIAVDGGTAVTVTIDQKTAVAGGATDGKITSSTLYADVINKALENAGLKTKIEASKNANDEIVLTSKATSGATSIEITDVDTSKGVSILELDVSAADAATLKEYRDVVVAALGKLTDNAATLGAIGKRIELQETFVSKLIDTIDKGISGLVDADMNEESTRLQALQVKQQLGVQALSIANQSAQNVLRLFQ